MAGTSAGKAAHKAIDDKLERIGIMHQMCHFDCCHAGGIFTGARSGQTKFQVEEDASKPCVISRWISTRRNGPRSLPPSSR